jgi:beta-galactosidase
LALSSSSCPKINQESPTTLSISSLSTRWKFDLLKGALTSWVKGTTEVIHTPPTLDFYRPLTDNDRPSDGAHWLSKLLHQAKPHTRSVTWTASPSNGTVNVIVQHRIAPPVLEWSVDTVATYIFTPDGVHINLKGMPQGINLPETMARIGLTLALHKEVADTATWFGRGPGESYVDKKMSQRFGTWQLPIEELWTSYEFPQESENRTDVRRVRFHLAGDKESDVAGLTARFGDQEGCSFSASHYRCDDIDAAKHPFELERMRREEVIVRLDWRHHGLGTGSCGPKTLDEYALKSRSFEFDVWLE